ELVDVVKKTLEFGARAVDGKLFNQPSSFPQSRIDNVEDGEINFFSGADVGDLFVKHFERVLGRKVEVNPITESDHLFVNKLSQVEADCMVSPISNKDIKATLFGIADDKAHRLDGLSSKFFKSAWSIVGSKFTKSIKDFFHNGKLLKEINATVLALVPKVKTPRKVSDFRHISCCTVFYKCISKVIANRIKGVLNSIVSSCQSAVIPSRKISDNIMLTQELMRNYHRMGGPSKVAFKIDINKAYLGVQLISSRLYKKHCGPLIDKVKSRLHNWKNKALSFAGRLQLLRSVISSIQVFWSSVYILPMYVSNEIEKLMMGFIWSQGELQRVKKKLKTKDRLALWMDKVNLRCHWKAYLSWIVMRICYEYYSLDKVLRKDVGSMEGQEKLGWRSHGELLV
nr:hypothetical protein [Tanacetum cinerariifolium]